MAKGKIVKKYKILTATEWSKGKPGMEPPCRIVVAQWYKPDGTIKEYSRHWQNKNGDLFWGHYFQGFAAAMNDFQKTYKEHNATYRAGNQSHLPGIAFTSPDNHKR